MTASDPNHSQQTVDPPPPAVPKPPWFTRLERLLDIVTGEPMLRKVPNGGALIVLRATWITAIMFALALSITEITDPQRSWQPELARIPHLINLHFNWLGTIFAGVYVWLYSRFQAQWKYLADLYYSIKTVEARIAKDFPDPLSAPEAVCEMKAGFIHDVCDLHLAHKEGFRHIIDAWYADPRVKAAYGEV